MVFIIGYSTPSIASVSIDSQPSVAVGDGLTVALYVSLDQGETITGANLQLRNIWGQKITFDLAGSIIDGYENPILGYANIYLNEPIHLGYWEYYLVLFTQKGTDLPIMTLYSYPDINKRIFVYDPSLNKPVAVPEAEAEVYEGDTVYLDGSLSYDPDGNIVSYNWEQTDGTPVALSDISSMSPTFIAPSNGIGVDYLIFRLTVTDNDQITASDYVGVHVYDPVSPIDNTTNDQTDNSGGGGGGGCTIYADSRSSSLDPLLILLVTFALVMITRRNNYTD